MVLCSFTVGDLLLGIDIMLVREIRRATPCTQVPGAPDFYMGLVNIRGQVATIADLRTRLGWEQGGVGQDNTGYFIIMKTKPEVKEWYHDKVDKHCPWEDRFGLRVDKLGVVQDFGNEGFQPRPANLEGISARFAKGVIELDRKLLVVLNLPALMGFGDPEKMDD
ncbi:CheW protein [Magnetococcus marinus MC-1]|uniref:CheW protein n=1 Tax=Magnetococcus marinus (strain ATCC BAA-1437 / JCM 17883 / MC-1) TaxID=156889 RepID=A0LCK1_MAGMM|nr:chemotaxis protein CheW [Magnetococcus marinus]ABK45694.1 CheW protein [Magnetococcus marinus MC-1]